MKDKQFTTRFPIHKAVEETEDEMNPIQELSQQRPLHHGERADTMLNDAYCDVPQASDDEEDIEEGSKEKPRMKQNVDEIAHTIMQMIDAVDVDENTKIKTICIEIGLE